MPEQTFYTAAEVARILSFATIGQTHVGGARMATVYCWSLILNAGGHVMAYTFTGDPMKPGTKLPDAYLTSCPHIEFPAWPA